MKLFKNIFYFVVFIGLSCYTTSCKDYLDSDPDLIISDTYAFESFYNFQGFIEEMYRCIPDKLGCNWTTSFNWGDDEIMNTESTKHVSYGIDNGDFWAWQDNVYSWLDRSSDANIEFKYKLWTHAWYCIRKANLGLENIDKMQNATEEERNLIEGQLRFFRAWFHFEMMQYLGGLPYIETVLPSNEELRQPRLSFKDCALKVAADLKIAADILPINWDDTTVGKQTVGKNELRINKIMALGYLGKVYLWAGSPLIKNGAMVGASKNGKTYDYDEEMCKLSADAFGSLLYMVENGETQYALVEFKYEDIYNHVKDASAETCYTDLFYTKKQSWLAPGSTEAIFRGPVSRINGTNNHASKTWGPHVDGLLPNDNSIHLPTANYVKYYGMANGLPLTDEAKSGFDVKYPYKNRDPRFYHDIIFDGFKYINGKITEPNMEKYKYSELFTGGNVRSETHASRTGYFTQKLAPHTCNIYDNDHKYAANLQMYLSYMRLADIYLMYAEACAAIGGYEYASEKYPDLTALDAINTLRRRVGAGCVGGQNFNVETQMYEGDAIDPTYYTDNDKFIDEIRRERAVELAFEGFRFCDLQRWLLLTEYPYNIKTSQEFDRVHDNSWYEDPSHNPKDAEVNNWREEIILERNYTEKHYWFPFKNKDVSMYPEFSQNPGW